MSPQCLRCLQIVVIVWGMEPFDFISQHLEAQQVSERQFSESLGMSPGYLFSLRTGRHHAKVPVAQRIAASLVDSGVLNHADVEGFVSSLIGFSVATT